MIERSESMSGAGEAGANLSDLLYGKPNHGMKVHCAYVIERKTSGPEWEAYAYPKRDWVEAVDALNQLREQEKTKRIQRPLRLVFERREYFDI